MTDIDAKLQYLLDRLEIHDCIYRYARALDRHDDPLLTSVFHEDALDNHGPWAGGRTDFVEWANHECHQHLHAHAHNITTHACEIDGDTAHTESYVQFVHRDRDERTVFVGGGRYIDRLERRDGEWRIAIRRLIMDYSFVADGSVFSYDDGYQKGTWDRTDVSYERPLEMPPDVLARIAAAANG